MFQGLGRHLRSVSHLIGKCSLFPVVMDYGLYPPPYRYTADQVPYQNMQVTHTIYSLGATSVHIKKQLGDAKQRFCTLQVTGMLSCGKHMFAQMRIARYHCCIWHSDMDAFQSEGSFWAWKRFEPIRISWLA